MSVEDIQKLTEAGKNPVGQYVAAVLDEGDGQGRHQQYVEVSRHGDKLRVRACTWHEILIDDEKMRQYVIDVYLERDRVIKLVECMQRYLKDTTPPSRMGELTLKESVFGRALQERDQIKIRRIIEGSCQLNKELMDEVMQILIKNSSSLVLQDFKAVNTLEDNEAPGLGDS